MKKDKNYNGTKKGSKMTVHPIRRIKDIQTFNKLLSDNPRNLLFVMVYVVGFGILCKRFSHSSPEITMRYLGIEDHWNF